MIYEIIEDYWNFLFLILIKVYKIRRFTRRGNYQYYCGEDEFWQKDPYYGGSSRFDPGVINYFSKKSAIKTFKKLTNQNQKEHDYNIIMSTEKVTDLLEERFKKLEL